MCVCVCLLLLLLLLLLQCQCHAVKDCCDHGIQGAGDAFIGALAFYLSTQPDMSLIDVIRRANEIATLSVLASGTQKSFPWRSQLPSELFNP